MKKKGNTSVPYGSGYKKVNEVLKYPNDESKMLVAFLNTSVDGNKLNRLVQDH